MKYKVGDLVYTSSNNLIKKVKIMKVYDKQNTYFIHYEDDIGCGSMKHENELFLTKEEAIIDFYNKSKKIKEKIAKGIHSIEDLVIMMYERMNCYENDSYEAIEVAKEKVQELLGIDLSDYE